MLTDMSNAELAELHRLECKAWGHENSHPALNDEIQRRRNMSAKFAGLTTEKLKELYSLIEAVWGNCEVLTSLRIEIRERQRVRDELSDRILRAIFGKEEKNERPPDKSPC